MTVTIFVCIKNLVCIKNPSDTMANPNQEDLQATREVFHETVRYPEISVDFDVCRLGFTSRQTAFQSEDLVFTMNFHEIRTGQNMPIISALIPVYVAVKDLIAKLKRWFNDDKKRFIFMSAYIDGMASDVYSGGIDLGKTSNKAAADAILHKIYGYLISNTLVSLTNSNFQIKVTVISFNHSQVYDMNRKKKPREPPQRPLPTTRIGTYEDKRSVKKKPGIIMIKNGYPAQPDAFKSRCLITAFTIAKMIQEYAFEGQDKLRINLEIFQATFRSKQNR